MTINIAIAVSEGLVMAADSMTQVNARNNQYMKSYPTAEKLTELGGLPMAVMASGIGALSQRSIMSLIREFEFEKLRTQDDGSIMLSAMEPAQGAAAEEALLQPTVHAVATELGRFIAPRYNAVDWGPQVPTPPGVVVPWPPTLSIVIGGYSPENFFPEVFEVAFPAGNVNQKHPIPGAPEGSPSISWWGVGVSLNRLLLGFDLAELNGAHQLLTQHPEVLRNAGVRVPEGDLTGIPAPNACLGPLMELAKMRVVLDYMPLQEAVEFAEYLGQVAIGYSKFSAGVQIVGGELDVLAIQPEGLSWYKRKEFVANMASARKKVFR
jgi:hypothetical protein